MAVDQLLKPGKFHYSLANPRVEEEYSITGISSRATALTSLLAAVPDQVVVQQHLLVLSDIEIDQWGTADKWKAKCVWQLPDRKEAQQPKETGESEISFSVQGETTKLTHAIAQSKYGTSAPDHGTAINVDDKGQPQGIEVPLPVTSFEETHWIDANVVDNAYVRTLSTVVGRTNAGTFRGFAAGELLLTTVEGRRRGRGDWQCSFRWNAGENRTGLTIAGIAGVNKNAHDYVWVQWEREKDGTANRFKASAVGVYVAQVYESADYSKLKIGVA